MKNIQKDLLFIAQHVTEWPKGAKSVRFDADAEICFFPLDGHDFFVEPKGTYEVYPGEEHPEFIPARNYLGATGTEYTREQWEEARNEIRMLSR